MGIVSVSEVGVAVVDVPETMAEVATQAHPAGGGPLDVRIESPVGAGVLTVDDAGTCRVEVPASERPGA